MQCRAPVACEIAGEELIPRVSWRQDRDRADSKHHNCPDVVNGVGGTAVSDHATSGWVRLYAFKLKRMTRVTASSPQFTDLESSQPCSFEVDQVHHHHHHHRLSSVGSHATHR